jgi:hypothetical protein
LHPRGASSPCKQLLWDYIARSRSGTQQLRNLKFLLRHQIFQNEWRYELFQILRLWIVDRLWVLVQRIDRLDHTPLVIYAISQCKAEHRDFTRQCRAWDQRWQSHADKSLGGTAFYRTSSMYYNWTCIARWLWRNYDKPNHTFAISCSFWRVGYSQQENPVRVW